MIEEVYKRLSCFEYMDEQQLDYFKERLDEMAQTLRVRMNEKVEARERLADEADQASQDELYWMRVHLNERDASMMLDVERAQRKLRTGDYGYCDETGEEIGLKRLIANPVAALCTEAMDRSEKIKRVHAH